MFFFPVLGLMAEEHPDLLVVWAKDGAKPSFALNEKPSITFTSSELVIKTSTVEVAYDLSQLLRLTYERNEVSGVEEMISSTSQGRLEGDALYFPYLPVDSRVEIFQMDGTLVLHKRVDREGAYSVALTGLPKGNYVVRAQGLTYKITKR